ncbi:hypothetical protein GWI33_004391 [Rhynchophorus ferrugineus]|uniref:AB hydrolase-1 domain-containing protein n=1 Tax=Rhynchophorus ferrugineus TaxID=354439 RepID=A0A834MP57_RHYFE|nr:hypothetical protein GWI33_004391 [Rhynchophorus ferrugineus]
MYYLNNQLRHIIKREVGYIAKRLLSKELKTKVEGQTLNYVKVGQGSKHVLCFPGALGTIWSDFKPQIEGLDRSKLTVIAWDPPGYGFSRPPNRVFNRNFYENDAIMAKNFMESIGVSKFSLLGWSDGGISSLILAAKYPESVDKLVVWGANCYVLPADIDAFEKIRDIKKWSDRMKSPLIKLYTEEGLQKMWNDWCNVMQDIYKVLHGDKDPMVLPEHPKYLIKNIRNVKYHNYPDGKHNIHLKYSDDFNNLITDFILLNN